MIKYSQLPGVRSFKTVREAFNHISEELGKMHNKVVSETKMRPVVKKAEVRSAHTRR